MSRCKIPASLALCFGAALFSSGVAQASIITWSLGPIFSGATGYNAVLTNGTLVSAVDAGPSAGSLLVAPIGITFTANNLPAFNQGIFTSSSPGSTDANWNSIIDTAVWNFGTPLSVPNFLSGLTIGRTYQLQLFISDLRTCCSARTEFVDDGVGNNSPTIVQGSDTSIVGVFVAGTTTQTVDFNGATPILNAYVVRDITPSQGGVPEPSTILMMLGAGAVALTKRLRRA
jgi:hypothetical protein